MATFSFKQFSLENSASAMKVTTDSVLLGSWVEVESCHNILDIGTGTGIIALMMAQRAQKNCTIIGIDIDETSAKEAADNFKASEWAAQLCARHISLADFSAESNSGTFDLLVSNPPFFENSLKAPDKRRSNARHTDSLPLSQLIEAAVKLLDCNGRLAVIIPRSVADSFVLDAACAGLFLVRECYVKTTSAKPAKRVMLCFCKGVQKKVATYTLELGSDAHKKQVAEYYE